MPKTLKAVVDSLDKIAEEDRDYYVEKDGKFIANIVPVGGYALEDVEGLRSSLSKERESARDALEKLAEFGEVSPKQAREALRKLKDAANWKSDDKVKESIEQATADLRTAHSKEKETWERREASLVTQLSDVLIDRDALTAMREHGVRSPRLLLPHIKSATRIREDKSGRMTVEVLDPKGNPRLKDGQGNLLTIAELIGEMKSNDDFAPAFNGTNASGGGTPPTGPAGPTGGRTITRQEFDALPAASKMEFAKNRDNKVVDQK